MFRKRHDTYLASEIAGFLGRELRGEDCEIERVASIESVTNNCLVFFSKFINAKFDLREETAIDLDKLAEYSDVLLISEPENCDKVRCASIPSDHPRLDFIKALTQFFVKRPEPEIHASAVIEHGAEIGEDVLVGAHCYIGPRVRIGAGTAVFHNTVIMGEVTIGNDCVIKPNATIGSEGFSFVFDENALHHFPQIGRIVIGNHVWIGSNVCIERAALDETRIDDHCKIDDLVQIGHNANIHEACQITAGVIICGRVVLEPGCWVAPNAVIDNGVRVGHDALIGTGSVIRKDVEPNTVVAGVPGRVLRKR